MPLLFQYFPVMHLYQPDADSVSLRIEDIQEVLPMAKDHDGVWSVKLSQKIENLHGRKYHFEVQKKQTTHHITDPHAPRIEWCNNQWAGYFYHFNYRWQYPKFKAPPFHKIVIYETHLPALSRHQSAQVDVHQHHGKYPGARNEKVLSHLQNLDVAVEFLPLHASDELLGQDWGYFSTSFRAIRDHFAFERADAHHELMQVIDALHGRGLPVLFDVVFNHGGELWVRAWGKDIVYRKNPDGQFCQGSGCGETIRTEHPHIREAVIQSLLWLVHQYRINGFRFDLGALHDKETMLMIDQRIPKPIYLIAEPWALGGQQWHKGDMHGIFAKTRWAIWNDDFRESAKTFIKGNGDRYNRDRVMRAIKGSHIKDGGWAIRPQQSINYLSSHDGKTLSDFLFEDKRRVFLGALLVLTSQGIPMLGEGSELMYSKNGDINSYNRPDLNQINWHLAEQHSDLVLAFSKLIKFE